MRSILSRLKSCACSPPATIPIVTPCPARARAADVLARDVVLDHLHVLDAERAIALREVRAGRRHQARRRGDLDAAREAAPDAAAAAVLAVGRREARGVRDVVVLVPHDGDARAAQLPHQLEMLLGEEVVQQEDVVLAGAREQFPVAAGPRPDHAMTAALELAQRQHRAIPVLLKVAWELLHEPSESPAALEVDADDMVREGTGDVLRDRLRRAWNLISGNY